jgi:formate hydrogenlyase subunit 3/multisubunit Na+/H+ antiporter MnhD subunit
VSGPVLLIAAVLVPLLLLTLCLSSRMRDHMLATLPLAPLPALAAAAFAAPGEAAVDGVLFGLLLRLDAPGAMLLGASALLWSLAGGYAMAYLRDRPHGGRFAAFWLLTLTGSLGVFVAADLAGFYLAFALVSLAAYGLVVHEETARARRAARIYILLAVPGETCLLLAFMLGSTAAGGSLVITDVAAALPGSLWRDATVLLLLAGFGMKAGLVPLHVWLPLAHPAAPTPASAVLSGAIVKAGIIGLLRFLPGDAALPGWGEALVLAGLGTAFYGAVVGVTQAHPKTVLAYSTLSQMGLLVAVLGMALRAAGLAEAAPAVAFYATHHALAKGALFLAVGVVAATGRRRLWWVLGPAALLALAIGGLPLTGGALAKLAVKPPLGNGAIASLATLSAATTTLVLLHALRRMAAGAAAEAAARPPAGLVLPWLTLAVAAVVVPWGLHLGAMGGTLGYALAPAALWGGLWPVLLGGVLALLLWRMPLPAVPEGDISVPAGRALRAVLRIAGAVPLPHRLHLRSRAASFGGVLATADAALRRWPAAALSLLAVSLLVALALAAGR